MPDEKFDPDKPISLYPLTGEEVLKKVLGVEDEESEEDPETEE